MSWTDGAIVETIRQLRDYFNAWQFVETGTYKGINARFWSREFTSILTCEKIEEYYNQAKRKLGGNKNVVILNQESEVFLRDFVEAYKLQNRQDIVIFYLDAHFYDPKITKEKRFVVLDELRALKDFRNCVIIIHDFDNNLGHITYDGQPLNLELIRKELFEVNPSFQLYTNELVGCDPIIEPQDLWGLEDDADTRSNIEYAWTAPDKTYRGVLYVVPRELEGEWRIKRWNLD